jgi:hypothetical protein
MDLDRLAIAVLTALTLACRASNRDDVDETAPIVIGGDSAAAVDSAPTDTAARPADTASTSYPVGPRRVDISLTLSNSGTHNGTYQASGVASACGIPALGLAVKEQSFGVELPSQGDRDIMDLSFHADTLAPGGTTDMYYLSVSVRTKQGATPPSFVLRTNEERFNEKGKATLTVEGGTARLKITGKKERGETLDMSVVCKPT